MDRERLQRALADADVPILLMVLVHLTGERRWVEPPYRPQRDTRIFADESGGLPADVQDEVRAAALDVLAAIERGEQGAELDEPLLAEMMSACVGESVPPEYVAVLLEEMGLREPPPMPRVDAREEEFRVLIIGAGVSGICAAVRLQQAGIPFTVVEKNDEVGGTWYENRYPDAGVDTPNHFYSFSFTPHHDWGHYYSKQPEILAYLRRTAEAFDVPARVRLNTEVTQIRFDEATQRWHSTLRHADGSESRLTSNAVLSGVGALNRPKLPAIGGLDTFAGPSFHTSRWPSDVDVAGRRVAMIGTGASAVQAARTTAQRAAQLSIFQRSPQWITPNPIYRAPVGEGKRWLLKQVPFYAAWYRFTLFWRYADSLHPHIQVDPSWPHPERAVSARNDKHREFLARFIHDELDGRPDLIAKALPDYPPYGKRMLLDNDWFKTLRRENVALVTDPVERVTAAGVQTADGVVHPADVLVLATGFHASRFLWPMEVLGRGGRSLHEDWAQDDPRAHLGITVPGYPNLFLLLGPQTGLGHGGSAIFHIEAQVRYAVHCLAQMVERGIGALEPDEQVTSAYVARVDAAHERMVFAHPGMNNWYKNRAGRVVALSPWRLVDYWAMTRRPDLEDFVVEPARAHAA
ncbi:MAG TPA: NAD(P)/FAD-dependent oxidoreductase [Solirubrobacteraceae bacterium]|jgi:4-hydroxyacetophenone monooxygenase|nr:NAD(P)/FAD-dependent oxidoreductase [Solirubrobacteraceae bacterium]